MGILLLMGAYELSKLGLKTLPMLLIMLTWMVGAVILYCVIPAMKFKGGNKQ